MRDASLHEMNRGRTWCSQPGGLLRTIAQQAEQVAAQVALQVARRVAGRVAATAPQPLPFIG